MRLLLAAALLFAAAPVSEIGHVTRVFRSTDVQRGKNTTPLKEKDAVAENDRIRTQSSGRARIVLSDGSILSIGASSLLTVRGSTEKSRAGSLEIAYGRIRAEVTQMTGQRNFEVRTSTAVCGVLGTTLFVDSSRGLTRVANLSDAPNARVRVTSSNARTPGEVILLPGQGTSVSSQGPPEPPRRWSVEEVRAANGDTDVP